MAMGWVTDSGLGAKQTDKFSSKTIWVIAMIIFRGLAIALLIQFAPWAELPKAIAVIGLGAIIGLMALSLLNHSPVIAVGLLLAFSCSFGLIFISQIPFALGMVPAAHAGLGTGLYFGGMGAATALFSVLMRLPGGLTPSAAVVWACAFLIASVCLTICWQQALQ